MGKSTISMAIFNSYVSLPEGMWYMIYIYIPPPLEALAIGIMNQLC